MHSVLGKWVYFVNWRSQYFERFWSNT